MTQMDSPIGIANRWFPIQLLWTICWFAIQSKTVHGIEAHVHKVTEGVEWRWKVSFDDESNARLHVLQELLALGSWRAERYCQQITSWTSARFGWHPCLLDRNTSKLQWEVHGKCRVVTMWTFTPWTRPRNLETSIPRRVRVSITQNNCRLATPCVLNSKISQQLSNSIIWILFSRL